MERTEAILDGMVRGLRLLWDRPQEVWWDNPKTVVSVHPPGALMPTPSPLRRLASHYVFDPRFCMPAHGNEKPDAEGTVKAVQSGFATPMPGSPTSRS